MSRAKIICRADPRVRPSEPISTATGCAQADQSGALERQAHFELTASRRQVFHSFDYFRRLIHNSFGKRLELFARGRFNFQFGLFRLGHELRIFERS